MLLLKRKKYSNLHPIIQKTAYKYKICIYNSCIHLSLAQSLHNHGSRVQEFPILVINYIVDVGFLKGIFKAKLCMKLMSMALTD